MRSTWALIFRWQVTCPVVSSTTRPDRKVMFVLCAFWTVSFGWPNSLHLLASRAMLLEQAFARSSSQANRTSKTQVKLAAAGLIPKTCWKFTSSSTACGSTAISGILGCRDMMMACSSKPGPCTEPRRPCLSRISALAKTLERRILKTMARLKKSQEQSRTAKKPPRSSIEKGAMPGSEMMRRIRVQESTVAKKQVSVAKT
mmetsp:Transcript_3751/g.9042  ORF Transcript_3751/g.9042 Transcript_3751/m.9042 type:complete len:201 (-) Transcript_3751:1834-2436(-)